MKIFVGTLYSGENEFEECRSSIRTQTYTNYDHYVIENLPNKEAHVTLFKTFLEKSNEYDLLIKIDADTVLLRNSFFQEVIDKMIANPWLDVFCVGISDFYTGSIINGIATYRNNVRWNFDDSSMFVDIPLVTNDHYQYDASVLAPAAIHCKNPTPFHAFHFGVHRGLKSIQRIHSTSHWKIMKSVQQNFNLTADRRLGLAVLGSELVYLGMFRKEDVDYTNSKMRNVFSQYENFSANELSEKIQRLQRSNWGFLSSTLRQKVLRQIRGRLERRWE